MGDYTFEIDKQFNSQPDDFKKSKWNYTFPFVILFLLITAVFLAVFNAQVVRYNDLLAKSENNTINYRYVYPDRGVIYDRNGELLAQNVPSVDLFINVLSYLDADGELDKVSMQQLLIELEKILGKDWQEEGQKFTQLSEKLDSQYKYMMLYPDLYSVSLGGRWDERTKPAVSQYLSENISDRWKSLVKTYGEQGAFKLIWRELEDIYYQRELSVAKNLSNEQGLQIRSLQENYNGIRLDEGAKRNYLFPLSTSHILGYVGPVNFEDWSSLDYVGLNDYVGRLGIERVYDKDLIGQKGLLAFEVDAFGRPIVTDHAGRLVNEPVSGKSLYLSLDISAQNKMYDVLESAVDEYDAVGGVGIIQDIETGEILTMVSYPSYDNNLFIEGISKDDYAGLSDEKKTPMLNRAIAAQLPPGSTFKILGALAGLDSGAITQNTIYVSRRGYTFSNGAPFQDYRGSAYGPLNVVGALGKSSNIFFCEMIRNWDIDELIPYYEKFGVGSVTGIDLFGEAPGRLPSPANKIAYAKLPGVTWLDPIWYPEGDGCNTVIGQGIALTTPIQLVNLTSAIANGGTLNTPSLAREFKTGDKVERIPHDPIRQTSVNSQALSLVRQGMLASAQDSHAARGNKANFAQKTGTAEFGRLNEKGQYENTHAWVTGFFPYDKPQYSFVILLEDGGESYNSVFVAKEFTDWWVTEGPGVR